ncbi:MAG: hypothetical protein M5U13_17920 [Thermoanaerobaculia bacterium]|nr:hypothetical protein [Thermoanaerobaculia bacterium]
MTDVYAAREAPIPGVTGELVVAAARAAGHGAADYCPDWAEIAAVLARELAPGDVVLTLGAGDIVRLGERLAGGGA